jgi:hypothetical protein
MTEPNATKEISTFPLPVNTPNIRLDWHHITDCHVAAMYWYGYGLKVIPILPNTKLPALKWDPWLDGLDPDKIIKYWTKYPDHELGCIVGDDMIVYDADSPESIATLSEIEAHFGVESKFVVKTTKGEHHYYRRAAGTIAKSDSHSSEKYPDRIDVKTGRALVILPLSKGKTLVTHTAENCDELSEAAQVFIDAISQHNGRTAPSQPLLAVSQGVADGSSFYKIVALLACIDPDCGYEDWLHIAMAVFNETQGIDEGLAIFDSWSSKGSKYKGVKDIENKWRSFRLNEPRPVTIGTLIKMANDAGGNVAAIIGDNFETCEYEVVIPSVAAPEVDYRGDNPLRKYSLLGKSGEIAKQVMEEIYVLDEIALLGQATVIYAASNTGKTLSTLKLLIGSIQQGRVDSSKVYYINVDDSARGLLEKVRIAEEYEFHMLAEGYLDFKVNEFLFTIKSMIESDNTRGVVIILDTLKKFVDLMDKRSGTHFGKIIRSFVMKGGTIIGLAHTNKNPGRDGKKVHAGTTDIVEDFDCAYILDAIPGDSNRKVVEFTNLKKRGNVALSVSFSYALKREITYNELLLSVEKLDEMQLIPLKQAAELLSDAEVITAIEACIKDGINTKMKLAEATAERSNVSKRVALNVIEKYTGDDPAIHKWSFVVADRGAKVYKLLEQPSEQLDDLDNIF